MSMFKQVADIRTADTLTLDVPDCDYQVVQVEATPFQQELVQELADRADAINNGNVDPHIDNMLKINRYWIALRESEHKNNAVGK